MSEYAHFEKRLTIFPSPDGMSLTELSMAGNNLIIYQPCRESLVSAVQSGDMKIVNLFYGVLTQEFKRLILPKGEVVYSYVASLLDCCVHRGN
jgi:hypothetical protein